MGCTDEIGKVIISTAGEERFKPTEFHERRAPYYSFGNRDDDPFIHGRNRKPTSFIFSASVLDKAGNTLCEEFIDFSFSESACTVRAIAMHFDRKRIKKSVGNGARGVDYPALWKHNH